MAIQGATHGQVFSGGLKFIGAIAASLALAASAHASLLGTSATATLDSPNGVLGDTTPVLFTDTVTVSAGQEIKAGNGSNIGGFMLPAEFIDFTDTSIWVRVAAGGTLNSGALVTGYGSGAHYTFSALNPVNETISGFSVSVGANEISNLAALTAANWISQVDAHTFTLALDPILFVDPGTGSSNAFADVKINFTFKPTTTQNVPEPASVALLAAALGALAWSRKRA